MTHSSEVTVRGTGTSITRRARGDYDQGQLELIRASVAKECNAAELGMFLEVCARYELDPFSKQVWALKIQGGVQVVVSRDGLLALAQRHTPSGAYHTTGDGRFLGHSGDVLREFDEFDKTVDGDGKVSVVHKYRTKDGKPTHGGAGGALRGPIVGSWCVVRRQGMADTFFLAYWSEYAKQNVWKSNPSAMMLKVAETYALRKAFSVSGVVGETEVDARKSLTAAAPAGDGEPTWPEDLEQREFLERAFAALGYKRAKQRALTNACASEEDFSALALKLSNELDAMGEGEETVDAEVVTA